MRNTLHGFCWLNVGVTVTFLSGNFPIPVDRESVVDRDPQFLPIMIDTPVIF